MKKDLQKTGIDFTPIDISEETLNAMQKIVTDCAPIMGKDNQTFTDSVVIANGMLQLKEFMKLPDVQKLVGAMANTEVGFLTDKAPGTMKWDNRQKKKVKVVPYTHDEIVGALIPPMLDGYRFTGNEINIISGKGMPVKKGKFRKINEFPGVTDFNHSIGTPKKEYFDPQKENGVARMKCQASWKLDGHPHTLGYGEDVCIIAIEFDKYSGIDKMIGLADSKIFSRVLTRLTGKFTIEGEDGFENPNTIDVTPKKGDKEGDKRPLPTKQDIKPTGDQSATETKSAEVVTKDQPTNGIDWSIPENAEGLHGLFDAVWQVYKDDEQKAENLGDFLEREPADGIEVEFYEDYVSQLKKIIS